MENTNFFFIKKFKHLTVETQIFLIVVLYIFSIFYWYYEYKNFGTTQLHKWVSVSVFFAPIFEEIIFRWFIFALLLKNFNFKIAIFLSSFLFWIWHLKNIFFLDIYYVIYQTIYTFLVIWIINAYITYKTKSIWIWVIIHYLNNLLAVFLTLNWFSINL